MLLVTNMSQQLHA